MKILLPVLKTKLFILSFVSACTVILATTVPQIKNFIAPEKAIGEKITTEQKKITPKIKKQNRTVSSSRVTSGLSLDVNNSFEATVTSDKDDYAPLSTAIFTGNGFGPIEEVVLKVKNLNQPCNTVSADSSYFPWTVTTDESGHFETTWTVCNCPGDSLRLKAVGQTSGLIAYAYFTDGNVTFKASGLPDNTTVTVNYSFPTDGLGSISTFSTGNGNGSSDPINTGGTQQNQVNFYHSFPATIVVGTDTYNFVSSSSISPVSTTNAALTITGTYELAGGSGGLTVTAPTCAQGGSFEITYSPPSGADVTETKTTPFSFNAKKNTSYSITSIQSPVNGN